MEDPLSRTAGPGHSGGLWAERSADGVENSRREMRVRTAGTDAVGQERGRVQQGVMLQVRSEGENSREWCCGSGARASTAGSDAVGQERWPIQQRVGLQVRTEDEYSRE